MNIIFQLFLITHLVSLSEKWFTESPLQMMKKAFSLTLKALFVLKIFKLFFDVFGYVGKQLDSKAKVNFKIFDVIYITYCPTSQSDNQTMKFGELVEYNVRNTFLQKPWRK